MRRTARSAARFTGNAEWEAMKAARRNLSPAEAVQEVVLLQKRGQTLWSHPMASSPVDVHQLLGFLILKKIPFVLTGTHGISHWTGRPRNTYDVDIMVKAGRNHARAVKAVKELYPTLEAHAFHGVTAFVPPGDKQSVIDIIYPHRADLEETLAHPVRVEDQGLKYAIPSLEAALANKYGAMLTPNRPPTKRMQDTVDFALMVQHSLDEGQRSIDLPKLQELGERVWPGGGGAEILQLVEKVKRGETLDVGSLMKGTATPD